VANRPPVYLVHGERESQETFAAYLGRRAQADVRLPRPGDTLDLASLAPAAAADADAAPATAAS
jgi:hypothetical protein